MESRKWATCSFVFPLWPSNFWNFGILYSIGKSFSATLSEYGGFKSNFFYAVVALSLSFLNMASISAFVIYKDGSSDWATSRLAAEELSALHSLDSFITNKLHNGGASVDTGGCMVGLPAKHSMASRIARSVGNS